MSSKSILFLTNLLLDDVFVQQKCMNLKVLLTFPNPSRHLAETVKSVKVIIGDEYIV